MNRRILVVGCGSIGRRHVRNLISCGAKAVSVFDVSREQMERTAAEYSVSTVAGADDPLAVPPDLVLVCTPPNSHIEFARNAVARGASVFIEKPISNALSGVSEFLDLAQKSGRFVMVGYNLRFHRGLRMLKESIERGDVGVPLVVRAELGQYLPDWRPGTDYRTGYNASIEMGGGIILDASHEIDYVRWLAGEVASVTCAAGRLSSLEIEVEDAAAITMRMKSGAIAEIHLDSIQRSYSRNCKVIGEEGTLLWEYGREFRRFVRGEWETVPLDADPNEMYFEETRHLLQCLNGEAEPLVSGSDGRRVLEIALAARESSAARREITL